jgi:hypothetical protein
MLQQELLSYVINVLNANDIPYMLTGSMVSSMQGEPRLTHDIDVVVVLDVQMVNELLSVFPVETFYLHPDSIREAIRQKSMFNVIDQRSGDKVDFWLLTNSDFDQSRFSRRIQVDFLNLNIQISSPEDTILAKLRWSKQSGGSQKQQTDALRVYELQYGLLDMDYLRKWVKTLEIENEWALLLSNADPL